MLSLVLIIKNVPTLPIRYKEAKKAETNTEITIIVSILSECN